MKTRKIFTVISFILVLTSVSFANSVNLLTDNPANRSAKPTIRYEVTIHLSLGINICSSSLYLVQITDELGRPVAPPKIFTPGQNKYVFTEAGPVKGKRVASLVIPKNVDNSGCPVDLFTPPDVKSGSFLPGNIYSFDLYPVVREVSFH